MLGSVKGREKNTFSEEKMLETLAKNQETKYLCCTKIYPLETEENARDYLTKIRRYVWQNCIVLLALALIGIIVIGIKHD